MFPLKFSYCVILVCARMCKRWTTRGDKIHAKESKNVPIVLLSIAALPLTDSNAAVSKRAADIIFDHDRR